MEQDMPETICALITRDDLNAAPPNCDLLDPILDALRRATGGAVYDACAVTRLERSRYLVRMRRHGKTYEYDVLTPEGERLERPECEPAELLPFGVVLKLIANGSAQYGARE